MILRAIRPHPPDACQFPPWHSVEEKNSGETSRPITVCPNSRKHIAVVELRLQLHHKEHRQKPQRHRSRSTKLGLISCGRRPAAKRVLRGAVEARLHRLPRVAGEPAAYRRTHHSSQGLGNIQHWKREAQPSIANFEAEQHFTHTCSAPSADTRPVSTRLTRLWGIK